MNTLRIGFFAEVSNLDKVSPISNLRALGYLALYQQCVGPKLLKLIQLPHRQREISCAYLASAKHPARRCVSFVRSRIESRHK